MTTQISGRLLTWYARNARELPWRGSKDPYAIWVSEIMLQQTRVETVIPYYLRWMARFPTMQALAAADQQEVLLLWEGLGYYSRARNFQRAAQKITDNYGGMIPQDPEELRKLPGVGRYTAGAIASIAFGVDAPTLDGNIRRVYARLFDVDVPLGSVEGEKLFWELAQIHLPGGEAGVYNQALMDLGATICLPRSPQCSICPVMEFCQAHALGVQGVRPVKMPKPAVPHVVVAAGIIPREGFFPGEIKSKRGEVLLARRPQTGLLAGLWEYPGGKLQEGEDLPTCLRREVMEELGVVLQVGDEFGVYRHAYTHLKVTLHAFWSKITDGEPQPVQPSELRWVPIEDLERYPMGKIDRLISRDLLGETLPLFNQGDGE